MFPTALSRPAFVLATLPLFGLLAACSSTETASPTSTSNDSEVSLAEDGSDSAAVENDVEALAQSLVTNNDSSGLQLATFQGSSGLQIRNAGDVAKGLFQPEGCLVVADDGRTVTYTFQGCTGPHGLVRIQGSVRATRTIVSLKELKVDFVADDFQIHKATFDWKASATFTQNGPMQTVDWRGEVSGVSGRGKSFSRTNQKSLTVDTTTECLKVEGSSQGDFGGREMKTEITNYQRCNGACPKAGSITSTAVASGRSLTVTFDGSAQATFTGAGGRSVKLPLLCSFSP